LKIDEYFGPAKIDIDEWRDEPVRHRFVHGSFEGTYTRFAFSFPEPENYEGRFIQGLQGGRGGSEYNGYFMNRHLIAFQNHAYYIESNQGHSGDLSVLKGDLSILGWKASAATALFSREVAKDMYGEYPHHGYLYGGSGGGLRSITCVEAPIEIWDGSVPFIINRSDMASYFWSVAAWAGFILRDKIKDIVDATDPGGSGNPFEVLENDVQKQALTTLYRAGYARGAEFQLKPNPLWTLALRGPREPSYWNDFWTEPGFEGADEDMVVRSLLIDEDVKISEIITSSQLQELLELEPIDAILLAETRVPKETKLGMRFTGSHHGYYIGCFIELPNGRKIICTHNVGDVIAATNELQWLDDVQAGDIVHIDNKRLLAFCFSHRHLVSSRYPNMRQFFVDNKPIYKSSSLFLDMIPKPTGKFHGKMILLQNAQDRECWPDAARAYVKSVQEQLGNAINERFRIYWTENATHVPPVTLTGQTRYINYISNVYQALNDLIKWVEDGIQPPISTQYRFDEDGALQLPDSASKRLGIQPVVQATVNGMKRVDIKAGQTVTLNGVAEAPPNTGYFVRMDWDFDGSGTFPHKEDLPGTESKIQLLVKHSYEKPGTYFATFRVFLHRNGDKDDFVRHIINQARVRIIVT
jgi:hypothetical protein